MLATVSALYDALPAPMTASGQTSAAESELWSVAVSTMALLPSVQACQPKIEMEKLEYSDFRFEVPV